MPANVVKTERDERLWGEAKASAKEQGKGDDYAYVMGVFQRMKGRKGGEKKANRRRLYAVNPPVHMRDEFMTHPTYAVFDDAAGMKVAAFLDVASLKERGDLFRAAVKLSTTDLGEAYDALQRELGEKSQPVSDPESGDYVEGAETFMILDNDVDGVAEADARDEKDL